MHGRCISLRRPSATIRRGDITPCVPDDSVEPPPVNEPDHRDTGVDFRGNGCRLAGVGAREAGQQCLDCLHPVGELRLVDLMVGLRGIAHRDGAGRNIEGHGRLSFS